LGFINTDPFVSLESKKLKFRQKSLSPDLASQSEGKEPEF